MRTALRFPLAISGLAAMLIAAPFSAYADLAKGKELFSQRCSMCHGESGAGDGPVAASLPPDIKPRNLQLAEMKFATDDAKLTQLLKNGGGGVGLNPLMPPQPDLNDADLASVISFVHTLKK